MRRDDIIEQLKHRPDLPVLVVGAGINGVGVFRELALQGVDVLLIDRADFGAGASAAPSRMIHGGLRYLENGEFRLVRESLRERDLLLQNAAHYVGPLPTTIPIDSWWAGLLNAARTFLGVPGRPAKRGALVVKLGLMFYDAFTEGRSLLPKHTFQGRGESLAAYPALRDSVQFTATYYDAWIAYPERLCLELALDAEALHDGARSLTYTRLAGVEDGAVILQDELTGQQIRVRPQVIVNAAGGWIDELNGVLGRPTQMIGGTKGSHLVLDHPLLYQQLNGHMLLYENFDGRVCIIFPLHGRVLVGATDIRVEHPDEAVTTDAEINYMLASVREIFPQVVLERSQVVFHFCGVRPLPYSNSNITGQISRDHSLQVIPATDRTPFPIYAMIGGKWTTFRAFAEQTSAQVLQQLGKASASESSALPIGGGKDYPTDDTRRSRWIVQVAAETGLDAARLETLLARYGTRARAVATYLVAAPDTLLRHVDGYTRREVAYIAQLERVTHLTDLLLRRTVIAFRGGLSAAALAELAQVVGDALGWSPARCAAEQADACTLLTRRHGVTLQPYTTPHEEFTP